MAQAPCSPDPRGLSPLQFGRSCRCIMSHAPEPSTARPRVPRDGRHGEGHDRHTAWDKPAYTATPRAPAIAADDRARAETPALAAQRCATGMCLPVASAFHLGFVTAACGDVWWRRDKPTKLMRRDGAGTADR